MNRKTSVVSFVLLALTVVAFSGCGSAEKSTIETVSDVKETKFDCQETCANYVDKCLTLVPGATQQLFVDGLTSCAKECEDWDVNKAECILKAENCTLMTEECKL